MREIFAEISSSVQDIFGRITITDVMDVLIVAVIVYQLMKLLRQTRASQVIRGMAIILAAMWLLAEIFKLQILSFLLDYAAAAGAVVLVVLFQPELRRAFEQIGRRTSVEKRTSSAVGGRQGAVENLCSAMLTLSRRKVGALIVLEQRTGLSEVIESGTPIDSVITAPLLENIFEPNTPLHDGAVIIHDLRVVAAGCVLPLIDDNMLSRELGTRHRAGLGVTEGTDAISLIVSEETGTISFARGGKLTRHLDQDALTEFLTEIYQPEEAGGLVTHIMDRWRKRA